MFKFFYSFLTEKNRKKYQNLYNIFEENEIKNIWLSV